MLRGSEFRNFTRTFRTCRFLLRSPTEDKLRTGKITAELSFSDNRVRKQLLVCESRSACTWTFCTDLRAHVSELFSTQRHCVSNLPARHRRSKRHCESVQCNLLQRNVAERRAILHRHHQVVRRGGGLVLSAIGTNQRTWYICVDGLRPSILRARRPPREPIRGALASFDTRHLMLFTSASMLANGYPRNLPRALFRGFPGASLRGTPASTQVRVRRRFIHCI